MEKQKNTETLLSDYQYKILICGIIAVAIGFFLMIGGGSDNPEVYSDAIFDFRRIHLAPTLVLLGFAICVYSIFAKTITNNDRNN